MIINKNHKFLKGEVFYLIRNKFSFFAGKDFNNNLLFDPIFEIKEVSFLENSKHNPNRFFFQTNSEAKISIMGKRLFEFEETNSYFVRYILLDSYLEAEKLVEEIIEKLKIELIEKIKLAETVLSNLKNQSIYITKEKILEILELARIKKPSDGFEIFILTMGSYIRIEDAKDNFRQILNYDWAYVDLEDSAYLTYSEIEEEEWEDCLMEDEFETVDINKFAVSTYVNEIRSIFRTLKINIDNPNLEIILHQFTEHKEIIENEIQKIISNSKHYIDRLNKDNLYSLTVNI